MFDIDQEVRAVKDGGSSDWSDKDRARNRPWSVKGKIVRASGSHGLVYLVKTKYCGTHWYEESELEAVNDGE